jgi:hypothetical protein
MAVTHISELFLESCWVRAVNRVLPPPSTRLTFTLKRFFGLKPNEYTLVEKLDA